MTPDAEGQFVARGVPPGRSRVVVSGVPSSYHIASAIFNGVEVPADPPDLVIERREKISEGLVSFTSRVAEICGHGEE